VDADVSDPGDRPIEVNAEASQADGGAADGNADAADGDADALDATAAARVGLPSDRSAVSSRRMRSPIVDERPLSWPMIPPFVRIDPHAGCMKSVSLALERRPGRSSFGAPDDIADLPR
jgi:hypothetical protein